MTKTGKLSKRDRETILKAAQIMERWVKTQAEQGHTVDNSFVVHDTDSAACILRDLLWYTRGE